MLPAKLTRMQRNAELGSDRAASWKVLRAGAVGVVVVPVAHVEPVDLEPGALQSSAETAESTPPDMPTTILSRLVGTARIVRRARAIAHLRNGGSTGWRRRPPQRGVDVEARHRVERLTFAEEIILKASQHQRRSQALRLDQQLFVRNPQRSHDPSIERLVC
jgi:hypothetical protein